MPVVVQLLLTLQALGVLLADCKKCRRHVLSMFQKCRKRWRRLKIRSGSKHMTHFPALQWHCKSSLQQHHNTYSIFHLPRQISIIPRIHHSLLFGAQLSHFDRSRPQPPLASLRTSHTTPPPQPHSSNAAQLFLLHANRSSISRLSLSTRRLNLPRRSSSLLVLHLGGQ